VCGLRYHPAGRSSHSRSHSRPLTSTRGSRSRSPPSPALVRHSRSQAWPAATHRPARPSPGPRSGSRPPTTGCPRLTSHTSRGRPSPRGPRSSSHRTASSSKTVATRMGRASECASKQVCLSGGQHNTIGVNDRRRLAIPIPRCSFRFFLSEALGFLWRAMEFLLFAGRGQRRAAFRMCCRVR